MITERYQITDILKQSQQKSIYRVQSTTKQAKKNFYIVKKFAPHDKKYFEAELFLYNVVLKDAHLKGFPELKDVVQESDGHSIVLGELGDNAETLRKRVGGRFTLKTTLIIALQAIDRLQYLHSRDYIHGDVQPSNLVTGAGKLSHKIYLVDFQFASPFILNGAHVSEEVVDKFSGSIRYCSLAANQNKNVSRRDDLQALVYSLIFLIKGYLPWFELKSQTLIEAYAETAQIKKNKVSELLQGLPQAFGSVLKYVKQLKFTQKPNYEKIRNEFLSVMKKNGYEIDYKYDWTYV